MTEPDCPAPTERELEILKVIWGHGEATVREIYETIRDRVPIVQNTVQAFLRTMTQKGLVSYEVRGRTFVYRAEVEPEPTKRRLLSRLLERAYDGAVDSLVAGAVELRKPTAEELSRLRALVDELEAEQRS